MTTAPKTTEKRAPVNAALTAMLLALGLATTADAQADWMADTTLLLGSKRFQDTDWAPEDSHKSIGLVSDAGPQHWPLRIAIDFFGTGRESHRNGDRYDTFTGELDIGLRKVFELPIENCRLRPYLGAGLAMVFAEQDWVDADGARRVDDTGTGYWLGTGARFDIGSGFAVGIDVRYTESEVTLATGDADSDIALDALGVGLGIGLSW